MGTIKTDYITGLTGTEDSGPLTFIGDTVTLGSNATIPAAGVTGVLPVGVTGGSGLDALPAAGVSGTLGSGVTGGSGLDAIPAAGITGTLGSGITFPAGHITGTAIYLIESETIATASSSVPDYFESAPANAMTISMAITEKLIVQYAGGRTGGAVNNRNCMIVKITDQTKTEIIRAPCYGYGAATRDAGDGGFIVSETGYSGTTTVSLGVQSLDGSNTSQWIADDGEGGASHAGVYVLLQIYTPS